MTYLVDTFNPETHWEMVSAWWKAWEWPNMPLESLPKNGLVIYEANDQNPNDHIPIVAGWVYLMESNWGIMEWVVGNPGIPKNRRQDAIDLLIPALLSMAEVHGCKWVFSSVKHPTLISAYQRHGMLKTDEGMTNFIWRAE